MSAMSSMHLLRIPYVSPMYPLCSLCSLRRVVDRRIKAIKLLISSGINANGSTQERDREEALARLLFVSTKLFPKTFSWEWVYGTCPGLMPLIVGAACGPGRGGPVERAYEAV